MFLLFCYNSSTKGIDFHAFNGIPYAKAPIGDLRFQRALDPDPFQGIFSATNTGVVCTQV